MGVDQKLKEFVEDKIKSHKIVVFSKTNCPYCKATKSYFANNYPTEEVEVVELDTRDDGSAIQDYLLQKTGARSVPRTFINGQCIGGNSDLQERPKNEISALIESA
ncbi:putative glutaredoxin [Paxillus ammoniavirescens]|nr:putative glutaredoxin [Paxillus ammoniavirescens]